MFHHFYSPHVAGFLPSSNAVTMEISNTKVTSENRSARWSLRGHAWLRPLPCCAVRLIYDHLRLREHPGNDVRRVPIIIWIVHTSSSVWRYVGYRTSSIRGRAFTLSLFHYLKKSKIKNIESYWSTFCFSRSRETWMGHGSERHPRTTLARQAQSKSPPLTKLDARVGPGAEKPHQNPTNMTCVSVASR